MYIPNIALNKFYEELIEFIWTKHVTDLQKESVKKDTQQIWFTQKAKTSNTIFEFLFGIVDHKHDYFYQRKSEFKNSKYGSLNTELMLIAFKHLEITFPEKAKRLGLNADYKAYLLLQIFIDKHLPNWNGIDEEFKIYDEEKNTVKDISQKLKEIKKYIGLLRQKDQPKAEIKVGVFKQTSMELDLQKLIVDFYQFISAGKLSKAWDLLSPQFRERAYKENYEAFRIGYTYSNYIDKIHLWDIQISGDTGICNVYYEDSLTAFSTVELGKLDRIKIQNIDEFVNKVKNLADTASETSLTGFEKIEIQKLFEPAASEYIWYKCGMNPLVINELLPDTENITIPRLYKVTCINQESQWLIKGIVPITSRLIK